MGSEAKPLLNLPLDTMSKKKKVVIKDIRAIGDDWKITARPIPKKIAATSPFRNLWLTLHKQIMLEARNSSAIAKIYNVEQGDLVP